MEYMISISRPGKSWNSSEDHGKSLKTNTFSKNKKAKKIRNLKNNRQSVRQVRTNNAEILVMEKVTESHGILKSS